MNKSIFIISFSLLLAVGTAAGRPVSDKKARYIVLAEQARHYVAIVDAATQRIVWTWDVSKSGLPAEHRNWFNCPTEIKPVYGGQCILIVSNGGIGLIRIADHRMIWYAASGGGFVCQPCAASPSGIAPALGTTRGRRAFWNALCRQSLTRPGLLRRRFGQESSPVPPSASARPAVRTAPPAAAPWRASGLYGKCGDSVFSVAYSYVLPHPPTADAPS